MTDIYDKIKFRKENRIKKFHLDCLSFKETFSSADQRQEQLKLSDIVGLTETNNSYNLGEFVVALSAPDSDFLLVPEKGKIIAPYNENKLYQKGSLCYPPFDHYLGNSGFLIGVDVVSDNQGDYHLNKSGREKINLRQLREILRKEYVDEVTIVLSVKNKQPKPF
ncbi:MAG: hypothetical protein KKA62_02180 [Nanoarchaeota archaeon]|nr:hypothetical protein [Nanoarchaeota archaeon]MBU1644198.1 hypothetical protein [Nanoarchaeota archaeon]MBU1976743.1 hypothetical protein [Nanoarchaeota archaeon]